MAPLRLVMTARRFWPAVGASERYTAGLAAGLVARGAEVTVLTRQWDETWPAEIHYRGAAVVRLPRPRQGLLGTRRSIRNLADWLRVHAGRYDLVCVAGLRDDAFAVLKTVGRRVPVVLRVERCGPEGDCLWQVESSFGRRVKRQALRAAAMVGPTETACRELVAAGYPRDRVRSIRAGVAVPPRADPSERQAARLALQSANVLLECPRGAPVAVYAGRLDEPEGPDLAILAWREVVRRWPAARLWLVGAGANPGHWNRRIDRADLVGRVVLPGAFASVEELLAAADLAIVPEGSGESHLLMLEAMAADLPVVAIDCPENRQAVGEDDAARFVPPGNPAAMGRTLVGLLESPAEASQLGGAGRQRVERHHTLDRCLDEHWSLFEALIEGSA